MPADKVASSGKWKNRFRRFLIGVGILVTLTLVVQTVRIKLARAALDRSLAEIERAGEPTHVEDAFMPPVDAAANRVSLWRDAHAHLQQMNADGSYSIADLIDSDVPLSAEHAKEAHDIVQANAETIAGIHAAIASPYPCIWSLDGKSAAWLQASGNLTHARELVELLCVAALDAHTRNDDGAAASLLMEVDTVRKDFGASPGYFGSVIGYGNEERLAATASHIAADWNRSATKGTLSKLPAAAIRLIIASLLDDTTRADDLHRAQLAQRVIDADQPLSLIGLGLTRSGTNPPLGNGFTGLRVVLLPNALNTAADFLRYDTEAIHASGGDNWTEASRKLGALDPVHGFLSFGGATAWPLWLKATFKDRATRHLSAVALAITLSVNEHHGEFPRSLDELTPRYIASIPKDPMTSGTPLQYKPGSAPSVYSVGLDGKDDGGEDEESGAGARPEPKDIVIHLLPR